MIDDDGDNDNHYCYGQAADEFKVPMLIMLQLHDWLVLVGWFITPVNYDQ